jgi:activator of HSP90 ATPase
MVLHNPNNWHWVNKDAAPWAKTYLEKELTQISAEEGDVSAKVSKLVDMDGDVDVSQRKGKVITIFDVKLQLEYEGQFGERYTRSHAHINIGRTKDGEDVSGRINVPEVAHDTEPEEYVVRLIRSFRRASPVS